MTFDLVVLRGVIVVWVFGGVGATLTVLLFLIIIEAVPGRDVFKTEDMFGSFGWEVFVRDEYAIGVRSSFVIGKIGHKLVVPLDGPFRLLLGDEVVTWFGFAGVERTNDIGNDIKVHSISSHGEELAFCFWPFPQLWFHALGS